MDAVTALHQVRFLKLLTPEEFQALADMMDLRPFVAGDKILSQGDPTTNFYIVDSGYVNLRFTEPGGRERPMGSKGPCEYFGVKMFTTQEASEYTFEAVNKAELWVVERQDWERLLEKFPQLLEHMPELHAEYHKLKRGLDWLAPGEVVHIVAHRHWWALFLAIRYPVFVALFFTGAYLVSAQFELDQRVPFVLLILALVLIVCLFWAGWKAILWWQESYIVTNKRAVRIRQVLFFSDEREELPIEKIQSQEIKRGGPISVMLNIADLHLTSASSSAAGGVSFKEVANVERIQRAIEGEKARVGELRGAAERELLRSRIAGEIRHYVFQQPSLPERAQPNPQTPTFQMRVRSVWNRMFGTEIRQDKTVTWRKHYWVLLQQVGAPLGVFILLLGLAVFVSIYGSPSDLAQNGVYLTIGFLMVLAFLYMVWQWMDWQVDLYRLTETHIIDIESLPFGLRYSEKRADLSKIQDVNSMRPRFVNTVLNFGNVISRVAGNAEPFTFNDVARPREVADEISARLMQVKLRETERNTRDQTRTVVDAIIAYHRLMIAERHQGAALPPAPRLASPAPTSAAEAESEFPPESDIS